jgi:hypothetical protein
MLMTLIVYDSLETDIAHMLLLFNKLHPNLIFTVELQDDMRINFLDLTIHRLTDSVYASIYLIQLTQIVIHFDSCHPMEHKLAGINHLVNRVISYSIPASEKEKEINISQQIINAN